MRIKYLGDVKRGRALLFLLLASFSFLGSLPLFWMQLKYVKHQMKERMEAEIDQNDLQRIEFALVDGQIADPQFAYRDGGKEFEYQGHYYDIFKQAITAGKIQFWVIADELEDQLLAKMLSKGQHEGASTVAAKTFLKFFAKSFPNPCAATIYPPRDQMPIALIVQAPIQAPAQDIVIPPPRA